MRSWRLITHLRTSAGAVSVEGPPTNMPANFDDFNPERTTFQNVLLFDDNNELVDTFNMGGCMGCHGVAQVTKGTDFSFILWVVAWRCPRRRRSTRRGPRTRSPERKSSEPTRRTRAPRPAVPPLCGRRLGLTPLERLLRDRAARLAAAGDGDRRESELDAVGVEGLLDQGIGAPPDDELLARAWSSSSSGSRSRNRRTARPPASSVAR